MLSFINHIHSNFILTFQKSVKRPKQIKYQHTLDPQGTSSGQQLVVTLILQQQVESKEPVEQHTPSPQHKIVHQSQSSPDLQGAWSQRSFLMTQPLPEGKGKTVVSDVPAY